MGQDGSFPDACGDACVAGFQALTSRDAWSLFDLQSAGYLGGVFDGRYAYFVPHFGNNGPRGTVARYDTLATLNDTKSWSRFDLTTLTRT